jgi:hypothetical protein
VDTARISFFSSAAREGNSKTVLLAAPATAWFDDGHKVMMKLPVHNRKGAGKIEK